MNSRYFQASIFLPAAALLLSSDVARERPNILFIAVDDLRPELGCYGNPHILSPNIDRLARSGMVFNNAYCQSAVCNPSRASLMTGLRPDSLKVWDLKTDMRKVAPSVTTLPQYFMQNHHYPVLLRDWKYRFGQDFPRSLPLKHFLVRNRGKA